MRIAVTGAAGYLGVNLVNLLVAEGHEVVAIDQAASAQPATDAVAWVPGDVLDETRMAELVTGCDLLFHLASRITLSGTDDAAWHLNTAGVSSVASAAMRAGVPRMVHCSSVHAFDQARCHGMLSEESPRSDRAELPVYDRSKYAGEVALRRWIDDGLDAVIVNPTGSTDIMTEVLKSTIHIPPTVTKPNGDRIAVLVARDLDFRSVYELRTASPQ